MISTISFDGVPRISFTYIRTHPVDAVAYITAFIVFVFARPTGLLLLLLVYVLGGCNSSHYTSDSQRVNRASERKVMQSSWLQLYLISYYV